ncbi:tripartite ATP-independent transporter DctP family solute receptor [Palleronia aestuarii]|uniref:Tripartite ATP-independent transporter DctP family solute receptor n=1 Tax=Palleronia aestuarii TaxID=568105 RepID=A0A2W7MUP9_9RHOB|nr:TRAP transporter substrate-binding protein [Palleronia aestuarii]PZX11301.1 tripartite ATP-independent transporter DctP family solute receptor [Palleronia aestuarii]
MKQIGTFYVAAGVAALGLSAAEAQTVLKVGLIDPPAHIDVKASEMLAEKVAEATDGAVTMEIYPAAQLGFANDMLSGMRLGTVEMFVGATTWLGAFDKDWWISGTPYVFNNQDQARTVHESELFQGLADKLAEEQGIRVLVQNWDRGPRNFIATEPVETIDDLSGLKIRVPPQDSWIQNFELAGAAPVPMPLSETFTGLQQGIVTATEQASNWLYANKYHTIAENLTRTGHNYEETGVMIAEPVWQSLTTEQQDAIMSAAEEISSWHNEQLVTEIEGAEQAMADEGVNVLDVDVEKWKSQFRENFDQVATSVGYSSDLVEDLKSQWD